MQFRSQPTFLRFLHVEIFIANTSVVGVHYKFGTLRLSVRRRRPITTQNSSNFRGVRRRTERIRRGIANLTLFRPHALSPFQCSLHPAPSQFGLRHPAFALCRHQIWP